jgi:hypothetical protein
MSEHPTADSRIHLVANLVVALGPAAVILYVLWSRVGWSLALKVAATPVILLLALWAAHRLAPRATNAPVERIFGRHDPK